jgi:hypothetical protein
MSFVQKGMDGFHWVVLSDNNIQLLGISLRFVAKFPSVKHWHYNNLELQFVFQNRFCPQMEFVAPVQGCMRLSSSSSLLSLSHRDQPNTNWLSNLLHCVKNVLVLAFFFQIMATKTIVLITKRKAFAAQRCVAKQNNNPWVGNNNGFVGKTRGVQNKTTKINTSVQVNSQTERCSKRV